jgi:hypothetical protein
LGTHRTKSWYTPGIVRKRMGDSTYWIQTGPAQFKTRHATQLKGREPDLQGKHVSLEFCAHDADEDDDEYHEDDDFIVEKVLAHRANPAVPGGLEFKVRWKGYGRSHDRWEPPSSFCPRITTVWQQYLAKHNIGLQAKDLMAAMVQAEHVILNSADPFLDLAAGG